MKIMFCPFSLFFFGGGEENFDNFKKRLLDIPHWDIFSDKSYEYFLNWYMKKNAKTILSLTTLWGANFEISIN